MRTFWHIILCAVAVGCTPKVGTRMQVAPPPTNEVVVLDEAKAIAIARQAIAANETWVNRATFEAEHCETDWLVVVWRKPFVPGGYRFVTIDEKGKVTGYYYGK